MKKTLIVIFTLYLNTCFSQEINPIGHSELCIYNRLTENNIQVIIHPVSMLFNGDNLFNLVAKGRSNAPYPAVNTNYINCTTFQEGYSTNGTIRDPYFVVPGSSASFNADYENGSASITIFVVREMVIFT